MSSEQRFNVTQRECFYMKLDAKKCLSKAKRFMIYMIGGHVTVTRDIRGENKPSVGDVTLSAATEDDTGQRAAERH